MIDGASDVVDLCLTLVFVLAALSHITALAADQLQHHDVLLINRQHYWFLSS